MSAQRFMLDTNIASYIVRGPTAALAEHLLAAPMASLCVSCITQGELLHGVERKPGAVNLRTAVSEFLSRLDILPWDSAAAARYGVLRAALELAGTPLGNLDTLIAAHALSTGAVLVTNDRAFSRVAALKVENWTAA